MNSRIQAILENRGGNHLLPFFWQHGESEAVLREEMARIHEAAIGAVCVESRPHPDFCGPRWWQDMDIIMDEARRRGMKVWVLDDAHFPTGFANGWIRDKYPEHKKIYLSERHLDVVGPQAGSSVLLERWLRAPTAGNGWKFADEDRLLAVVALPLTPAGGPAGGPALDLTARVADGRLYWDIPTGHWRFFMIVQTPYGGGDPYYINPIDRASAHVLIEAVYEPHYARYKADFGQTLAGFFSDEPNIGNGGGLYNVSPGRNGLVLPWRKDLLPDLAREFGGDVITSLPGLWHDIGAATPAVRYAYMNLVSRLYGECFAGQIGAWCVERGVEYIGHIIEDNDAHTRLGASAPHFFRAMDGQTMSGIDVVLGQVRPGLDQRPFNWATWSGDPADGEFYHYALAKLGASHAHIDPKKQGRAMCEIFGAYGWTAGLRLMKWLTDHMLVRGINHFVPHAFSAKEFPDPDCPPHFYARGKNPQYRHFRLLMEYTNRLSHLLSGGRHVAEAAVLYHAEAEWSGAYMSVKEPMRVLMQAQLDADIVPADVLACGASVTDGKLRINREGYGCLIVPWARRLPRAVAATLRSLLEQGVKIAFVQEWPSATTEDGAGTDGLQELRRHPNACVTELEKLPALLRTWGLIGVRTRTREPYLRRYEYRHDGLPVWMFFNEDPCQTIRTSVYLEGADRVVAYDPFANRLSAISGRPEDSGRRVELELSPDESVILLSGDVPEAPMATRWSDAERTIPLSFSAWQVSTALSEAYPVFTPWRTLESLGNLCQPGLLPDFAGTIRYDTRFARNAPTGENVLLDLGEVGEVAQVWLNGTALGTRICRPYIFDAAEALRSGENTLRVEVTNTLVYAIKDDFSRYLSQDPSGLIGPVRLREVDREARAESTSTDAAPAFLQAPSSTARGGTTPAWS
jgi:hypothetical protein